MTSFIVVGVVAVLVGAALAWIFKPKETKVVFKDRVVEVPVKLPANLEPAQGPAAGEHPQGKEYGWEDNEKFSVCPTCGSRLKVKNEKGPEAQG